MILNGGPYGADGAPADQARKAHRQRFLAGRSAVGLRLALMVTSPPVQRTSKTGQESSDWFDPRSWSVSVPATGESVEIGHWHAHSPVIDAGRARIYGLSVGALSDGSLTIQNDGSNMTLYGEIELAIAERLLSMPIHLD